MSASRRNLRRSKFEYTREVPDTFHLIAEYAEGHSLVLSSSMANSQHIPGLIRGHEGTIIMVENGQFESRAENIILRPEITRVRENGQVSKKLINADYKFGMDEQKIPVEQTDMMTAHINNFLSLHAQPAEAASGRRNREPARRC